MQYWGGVFYALQPQTVEAVTSSGACQGTAINSQYYSDEYTGSALSTFECTNQCTTAHYLKYKPARTTTSLVTVGNSLQTQCALVPPDAACSDKGFVAGVVKSSHPYEKEVLGVVSTKPGQILYDGLSYYPNIATVALAGRVPVLVNKVR